MNSNDNAPPSCFRCPSLLTTEQASTFFNKSVGTPVCARFGKPIGRITTNQRQQEVIAEHFASTCSKYGEEKPAIVNWDTAKFEVMLPDPATLTSPRLNPSTVSSCAQCRFFVKEDVVANELGWTTGLCSAKGKLLLASRYSREARACDVKDFGTVRNETNGLQFLPEFELNFNPNYVSPTERMRKQAESFVDPQDYETDADVSEDDLKSGIRAWREISDSETGNKAYLPIFDVNFFSSDDQELIPRTGDKHNPEDYVDFMNLTYTVAVLWRELDEVPAFWGQPGTGKTEFFRYMAWMMSLPYYRFAITASTELESLEGKMMFSPERGTYFDAGRFVRAWEKPCVMGLDEPNTGQNDVWQFLRPTLDNAKMLIIDANEGQPSHRDDHNYMGVAMNPAWDMRNLGANMLADADANRLMHLEVEIPPVEVEKEIIRKHVRHDGYEMDEDKLSTIMAIASDIRDLCDNGTLDITWAQRPQIKVARAVKYFGWKKSYRLAMADYLESEKKQHILDVVETHVE